MGRRGRCKVEQTDDGQELLSLFDRSEQQAYEEPRPLVLFVGFVAERSNETGAPERTMYRRVKRSARAAVGAVPKGLGMPAFALLGP